MMDPNSDSFFAKSLGVYFSKVFGIALGLTANIVICRELGVSGQGQYFLILSTAMIVQTLGGFGLPSLFVTYAGKEILSRAKLNGLVLFSCLLLFSFSSIISFILIEYTDFYWTKYLFYIVALSTIFLFQSLFSSLVTGFHLIKTKNFFEILSPLFFLFFVFILSYLDLASLNNFLFISVLSNGFISLSMLFVLINQFKLSWKLEKHEVKNILKTSPQAYLGTLATISRSRLNVFFLYAFSNSYLVGLYSVAFLIIEKLMMIPDSYAIVLSRKISQQKVKEARALIKAGIGAVLLSSILICLIGYFSIEWVIAAVWGSSFVEAAGPFKIMLLALLFYTPTRLFSLYLAQNLIRFDLTSRVTWLSLIVSLPFLVILNRNYSIVGASWAYVIQTLILFVGFTWLYFRFSSSEDSQPMKKSDS